MKTVAPRTRRASTQSQRAAPAARSRPRRRRGALRAIGAALQHLALSSACVTFGLMALLEIAPAAALAARERVTQTSLEGPLETPVWTLDLDFDGEADLANPTHATLRTADAYGAGHFGASRDKGRRKHEGADFMVAAGAPVWSPLGGEVTEIGYAYADDRMLRFIEIKDAAQAMSTRVFYVDPAVKVGDVVKAGDKIGAAENLALRYPGGMTNHIHIELRDAEGRVMDPASILPSAKIVQMAEIAGSGASGR